jgi:hypothetical protein
VSTLGILAAADADAGAPHVKSEAAGFPELSLAASAPVLGARVAADGREGSPQADEDVAGLEGTSCAGSVFTL